MNPILNESLEQNENEPLKRYYSFKEIEDMCWKLGEELTDLEFDGIVTMPLGGMVPACFLGKILQIKNIITLNTNYYDGEERLDTLLILDDPDILPREKKLLLVDDIVDSGTTMRTVLGMLEERGNSVTSAALHYKPSKSKNMKPDFYGEAVDEWIVYPWEINE
ncbi:hypothetical protein GF362_05125 [Candidatus Dojkabacteria bacterium]|nr:hypothetical protein [Candidatus Dojkabacteria bacterium]